MELFAGAQWVHLLYGSLSAHSGSLSVTQELNDKAAKDAGAQHLCGCFGVNNNYCWGGSGRQLSFSRGFEPQARRWHSRAGIGRNYSLTCDTLRQLQRAGHERGGSLFTTFTALTAREDVCLRRKGKSWEERRADVSTWSFPVPGGDRLAALGMQPGCTLRLFAVERERGEKPAWETRKAATFARPEPSLPSSQDRYIYLTKKTRPSRVTP